MNEVITFNELPKAVTQLCEDMAFVKRHLLETNNEHQPDPDCWFDLNELCEYLPDKPAKATVYGWVHNCLIPCHKGQKKLRFLKSEINQWLKTGKQKTVAEISDEADQYLVKKKKG